ncbi:type I-E CRISPR-associated protein Cse1/CasA [Streptomyces sp. NPDC015350]|uniref:type I-E CRISPR-associated protein Cse1/CasA n=1 Tax=Streptomyces sp. NPDC015350 TaxID=3364955 RepID=UPI0036F8D661
MREHSFPLATSGWIPVWDLDAAGLREVGLTEALARAHRLVLPAHDEEGIVLLRLLVAATGAVFGPQTRDEWDALWRAGSLDGAAVNTYMDTWADRLDLFDAEHPAFQCAALGEPNREAYQLAPDALGGASSFEMFGGLTADHPGWTPARAARYLLVLLAYDGAGIKPAFSGDSTARGGKVYGARPGPLGLLTHLHLEGATLKDTLLLNLPPVPRAPADVPVWERPSPGPHVRRRAAQGRLDWLTWPSRRIRLFAEEGEGGCLVTGFAVYEGDRLPDAFNEPALACDPMSVWRLFSGEQVMVPQTWWLDGEGCPVPWAAARTLGTADTRSAHSAVVDHAADAAERGTLPPDLDVHAVMSMARFSTIHRSNISGIVTMPVLLGTARQLGSPETRRYLYSRAWFADRRTDRLASAAVRVLRKPRADVAARLALRDLDGPWRRMVQESAADPERAASDWARAVYLAAKAWIEEQHGPMPDSREHLLAEYRYPVTQ